MLSFEAQVKQDFKIMEKNFAEFEGRFASIDTKLTQVVDALLGNSLTKEGGLVNDYKNLKREVKILQDKVAVQESFKSKILWGISIITIIALVLKYIADMYIVMTK